MNRTVFSVAPNLFYIPVLLAEYTAAVLLHIKAEVARLRLPIAKAGSEIAVEELDAVLFAERIADGMYQIVLLVRAYEQRCAERIKAMLRCVFRRALEAAGIAVAAAAVDIFGDGADEVAQAVVLIDDELHVYRRCVIYKRVAPCLVFLIWVYRWIVPVSRRLDAIRAQILYAAYGAGRAAAVEKRFFHYLHLISRLLY